MEVAKKIFNQTVTTFQSGNLSQKIRLARLKRNNNSTTKLKMLMDKSKIVQVKRLTVRKKKIREKVTTRATATSLLTLLRLKKASV